MVKTTTCLSRENTGLLYSTCHMFHLPFITKCSNENNLSHDDLISECALGPKLLPDHQEAHRPVGDPQETGQEQHSALLHRRAVCR